MSSVEIEGMAELNRKLGKVSRAVDPRAVAAALKSAMKPMLAQAISNAPTGTQAHESYKGRTLTPTFLKRNIRLRKLKRKDKTIVAYGIWAVDEAWYGQLIEAGWHPGRRSKATKRASRKVAGGLSTSALRSLGDTRKKKKGEPWLGPAWNQHIVGVERAFKQEMLAHIRQGLR